MQLNYFMKQMKLRNLYIVLFAIILSSCGEYNKILKSTDNDLKYTYAKKYFQDGKYTQAITLLQDLVPIYKGTSKAEESLYMLAQSYYNTKDYLSATEMFTTYYSTYPNGQFAENALFYAAYGMYLDSPDLRLDQSKTFKAIASFSRYMEEYPDSERTEQARKYLFELQEKLAYKELLNAKSYLRLGNYMGNNYESAVVVSKEALKSYPYSKYAEEFQMTILRARYEFAKRSKIELQPERFRTVVDEFYNYKNTYPTGKYIKEAEKYYNDAQRKIKSFAPNAATNVQTK